jgi:hypothetical protein
MAGTCSKMISDLMPTEEDDFILVNRKWRHSFVASNGVLTVKSHQQQGVCKNVYRLLSADDDDDDAMDLVSDTTKENQSHKAPNVNPFKRHKGISHDGMNANKINFSALMDDGGGRDGRREDMTPLDTDGSNIRSTVKQVFSNKPFIVSNNWNASFLEENIMDTAVM